MIPATTRAPMMAKMLRTQCEPPPRGERCPAAREASGAAGGAVAAARRAGRRLQVWQRLRVRRPRRPVPPAQDPAPARVRIPSRRRLARILRRLCPGRSVLLARIRLLALLTVRIPRSAADSRFPPLRGRRWPRSRLRRREVGPMAYGRCEPDAAPGPGRVRDGPISAREAAVLPAWPTRERRPLAAMELCDSSGQRAGCQAPIAAHLSFAACTAGLYCVPCRAASAALLNWP